MFFKTENVKEYALITGCFLGPDIKRIFAFLAVNTKYISSSELKTSEFSRVCR